jgi:hypothetical protein
MLWAVLRIRDVYSGSRIQGQKDSGSWILIHIKNLSIYNQKSCFSALGNMIRDVHSDPDLDFLLIPDPRFRIQGSKRHRILDLQH